MAKKLVAVVLALVVEVAVSFSAPRSAVWRLSPRGVSSRSGPVAALSPRVAQSMATLQARILDGTAPKKSAVSGRPEARRPSWLSRATNLLVEVLRLVAKSLVLTLVLQPAIASAMPHGLKHLAYLGYGLEDGEYNRPEGAGGMALPMVVGGFMLSRIKLKGQNKKEVDRLSKANNKIRAAEDEYFAVVGEAESDVDIMSELRQRSSNATNATDVADPGRAGPSAGPSAGSGGGRRPPPSDAPSRGGASARASSSSRTASSRAGQSTSSKQPSADASAGSSTRQGSSSSSTRQGSSSSSARQGSSSAPRPGSSSARQGSSPSARQGPPSSRQAPSSQRAQSSARPGSSSRSSSGRSSRPGSTRGSTGQRPSRAFNTSKTN